MVAAITTPEPEAPEAREVIELRPQPGPQEAFLSTSADIAFYGGAAGGGKTYGLVLEAARHIGVKDFAAVIFRRTYPEICEPGGLWDETEKIFPHLGGRPRLGDLRWKFPAGAVVKLAQMQHAKDRYKWQGSQICYIGWDELTHFEAEQFWYLFSRNRSLCGIRPYIRANTNPDPDHWVRSLIKWWINEDTGLPIPERSGVIRYMARNENELEWADTAEELEARGLAPRSFTFIAANLTDNPALMKSDPQYAANLRTLPRFERKRLLEGNWNVRPVAGDYFQKSWFGVVEAAPAPIDVQGDPLYQDVRYWDRAATEPSEVNPNPDWTVGMYMRQAHGRWFILDVERFRGNPGEVERRIKNTADQDGEGVTQVLEQDPGQAGIAEVGYLVRALSGHDVRVVLATKAKEVRARPVSSQAKQGNIDVVRAPWNDVLFPELEAFPTKGAKKDQVDTLSGSFNFLHGDEEVGLEWI